VDEGVTRFSGRRAAASAFVAIALVTGCGGGGSTSKVPTTPLPTVPEGATEDSGTTTTIPAVYIVKAGDSLSSIAKRFGLSVNELVAANQLGNANHIEEGQHLKIPPPTTIATTTTSYEP
jgi:LysM repeat protein